MPFKPLVTAGLETVLNTFLWRDRALKPARQRLLGKVLRIELQEFSDPVVLVLANVSWTCWARGKVRLTAPYVPALACFLVRNRQQLTALIRSGDLEVQGDLQVVQNTVTLCDLAEFDPAELLARIPVMWLRKALVKYSAAVLAFFCMALNASSAMSRKRLPKSGAWRRGRWSWPGLQRKPLRWNEPRPRWKNGWTRWRANDAGENYGACILSSTPF